MIASFLNNIFGLPPVARDEDPKSPTYGHAIVEKDSSSTISFGLTAPAAASPNIGFKIQPAEPLPSLDELKAALEPPSVKEAALSTARLTTWYFTSRWSPYNWPKSFVALIVAIIILIVALILTLVIRFFPNLALRIKRDPKLPIKEGLSKASLKFRFWFNALQCAVLSFCTLTSAFHMLKEFSGLFTLVRSFVNFDDTIDRMASQDVKGKSKTSAKPTFQRGGIGSGDEPRTAEQILADEAAEAATLESQFENLDEKFSRLKDLDSTVDALNAPTWALKLNNFLESFSPSKIFSYVISPTVWILVLTALLAAYAVRKRYNATASLRRKAFAEKYPKLIWALLTESERDEIRKSTDKGTAVIAAALTRSQLSDCGSNTACALNGAPKFKLPKEIWEQLDSHERDELRSIAKHDDPLSQQLAHSLAASLIHVKINRKKLGIVDPKLTLVPEAKKTSKKNQKMMSDAEYKTGVGERVADGPEWTKKHHDRDPHISGDDGVDGYVLDASTQKKNKKSKKEKKVSFVKIESSDLPTFNAVPQDIQKQFQSIQNKLSKALPNRHKRSSTSTDFATYVKTTLSCQPSDWTLLTRDLQKEIMNFQRTLAASPSDSPIKLIVEGKQIQPKTILQNCVGEILHKGIAIGKFVRSGPYFHTSRHLVCDDDSVLARSDIMFSYRGVAWSADPSRWSLSTVCDRATYMYSTDANFVPNYPPAVPMRKPTTDDVGKNVIVQGTGIGAFSQGALISINKDHTVSYRATTIPGDCGSPVWLDNNVIALHNYGGDEADGRPNMGVVALLN